MEQFAADMAEFLQDLGIVRSSVAGRSRGDGTGRWLAGGWQVAGRWLAATYPATVAMPSVRSAWEQIDPFLIFPVSQCR